MDSEDEARPRIALGEDIPLDLDEQKADVDVDVQADIQADIQAEPTETMSMNL